MANGAKLKHDPAQVFRAENFAKINQISDTQMLLQLEQGAFNAQEAWFLQDDEGQEFVVMPKSVLKAVIAIIRSAHEEKLLLELARDIAQQKPIDFDDVMAVAIDTLESKRLPDGSLPKINTKSFIQNIKKHYPNLFLSIPEQLLLKGMR